MAAAQDSTGRRAEPDRARGSGTRPGMRPCRRVFFLYYQISKRRRRPGSTAKRFALRICQGARSPCMVPGVANAPAAVEAGGRPPGRWKWESEAFAQGDLLKMVV